AARLCRSSWRASQSPARPGRDTATRGTVRSRARGAGLTTWRAGAGRARSRCAAARRGSGGRGLAAPPPSIGRAPAPARAAHPDRLAPRSPASAPQRGAQARPDPAQTARHDPWRDPAPHVDAQEHVERLEEDVAVPAQPLRQLAPLRLAHVGGLESEHLRVPAREADRLDDLVVDPSASVLVKATAWTPCLSI